MDESGGSCCSPMRVVVSSEEISQDYSTSGDIPEGIFVTIPAGEFSMGTDDTFYPTDGESPSRMVWVDEFQMGKYTVTNSEFATFIEATGYVTEAETFGWSYVFSGLIDETSPPKQVSGFGSSAPWWLAVEGAYWFKPYGSSSTIEEVFNHPVVHVTYHDAEEYCRWSGYKLPTEAQWEKASRGGLEKKLYPWGNDLTDMGNHNANIWQGEFPQINTMEDGFFGTAPVESFRPNDYGLHNTVGNVWEWTSDFWSARWHIPVNDETRRNPIGPQKVSGNKVLKGGSYLCHDSYCYRYRNSARTFNSPNTSTSHIGFRCTL